MSQQQQHTTFDDDGVAVALADLPILNSKRGARLIEAILYWDKTVDLRPAGFELRHRDGRLVRVARNRGVRHTSLRRLPGCETQ